MPVVKPEIQRIYSNLDASLMGALNDHPDIFAEQVTTLSGEGRQKIMPYFGALPGVTEFVGPRTLHDLATRVQTLTMKKWQDGFKMPEDDIEDQTSLDFWGQAAKALGEQFRIHRNKHYTEVLRSGLTSTWSVDGQFFYDSDHPRNPDVAGNTFSNRFDTAGGDARPLTPANADYVWTQFGLIKNENGDPMVLGDIVCEVPRSLATKAMQVWFDDMVVPAAALGVNSANILQPNINKGRVKAVIVNPYLDAYSTTRWYLHCVGRVIKPFIWWDGRPLRSTQYTNSSDYPVFIDGHYVYGADAKYICAFSMPHLSCTADV